MTLAPQKVIDRVLECIDRGLLALGENTREAIYWHVRQDYGLSRDDFVARPAEFTKALVDWFGKGGERVLERAIVNEMKREFEIGGKAETYEEAVASVGRRRA